MERPQLGFGPGKWNASSGMYGAPDVLFNGVCDGPLSCLSLNGKGVRYMTWTLARPLRRGCGVSREGGERSGWLDRRGPGMALHFCVSCVQYCVRCGDSSSAKIWEASRVS